MSYEAWRITFQSSEQAARSAYQQLMETQKCNVEEIASLQKTISNLEARDIHSCDPDCQRSGCVNRGLREQLAAAQAVSEKRLAAILQFRNEPLLERAHAIRKTEGYAAMEHAALDLPSDDTALLSMLDEQWEKAAKVCEKSDRYRGDYFAALIRAESEKLHEIKPQNESKS